LSGQASICGPILRSLPAWFGIEEATVQYIEDTDRFPTWLAWTEDEVAGFLTIRQHSQYAAEIHIMGIRPEMHRRGVGRALVQTVQAALRGSGIEYLQVKTLGPSHPDDNYAKTRKFYLALGFRPLEEFPDLWDEANPCLQMVKHLGNCSSPEVGV
jgi:N-acetylglutamate synthase-like GNAT family acetyltransferase